MTGVDARVEGGDLVTQSENLVDVVLEAVDGVGEVVQLRRRKEV